MKLLKQEILFVLDKEYNIKSNKIADFKINTMFSDKKTNIKGVYVFFKTKLYGNDFYDFINIVVTKTTAFFPKELLKNLKLKSLPYYDEIKIITTWKNKIDTLKISEAM